MQERREKKVVAAVAEPNLQYHVPLSNLPSMRRPQPGDGFGVAAMDIGVGIHCRPAAAVNVSMLLCG